MLKKDKAIVGSSYLRQLVDMQYARNELDLSRGKFRIKGDTLEIQPAYEELGLFVLSFSGTKPNVSGVSTP